MLRDSCPALWGNLERSWEAQSEEKQNQGHSKINAQNLDLSFSAGLVGPDPMATGTTLAAGRCFLVDPRLEVGHESRDKGFMRQPSPLWHA